MLYPKVPIDIIKRANGAWNGAKSGCLLYSETTEGHRIAATVKFEIPSIEEGDETNLAKFYSTELVRKLRDELSHGGVVDEHLADQVIILMALATSDETAISGRWVGRHPEVSQRGYTISTGPLTLHTLTAMRISEIALQDVEFSVRDRNGKGFIVTCERKFRKQRIGPVSRF